MKCKSSLVGESLPGWGLSGAGEVSELLGGMPLSLCLNISLGFMERCEITEAASWNTVTQPITHGLHRSSQWISMEGLHHNERI